MRISIRRLAPLIALAAILSACGQQATTGGAAASGGPGKAAAAGGSAVKAPLSAVAASPDPAASAP